MSAPGNDAIPKAPGSPHDADRYLRAREFLLGRIDYERAPPAGDPSGAFKLDRMVDLLRRLGDPQLQVPCVHIAGTKGKGSTAAMLAAVLTAAGHRTGLFTSPHIHRFEERVQIDGAPIPEERFADHLETLRPHALAMGSRPLGGPTFFELITALGWLEFTSQQVEIVVLEVGLGGRLDATNLCRPLACVITSISRDHTKLLGETHAEIAREKAGIIKPGAPVLTAVEEPEPLAEIREIAARQETRCYVLGKELRLRAAADSPGDGIADSLRPPRELIDVETPWRAHHRIAVPLPGRHQARNAALAIGAADYLDRSTAVAVPERAIGTGFRAVRWPLRIETVRERPLIILDAAHNVASTAALIDTLRGLPVARRVLIFGTSRDKEAGRMIAPLASEFDEVILTQFLGNSRALPVGDLVRIATARGVRTFRQAASPADALELARTLVDEDGMICVTGSFFLAGEVQAALGGASPGGGVGPFNRAVNL